MKLNNKGFGAVEIVLAVLIVGILGFVGYRAYTIYTDKPETGAEQSKYEFEETEKETKPQVSKTDLGDFNFVFPSQWKDLKKETPDDAAIALYSFSAGSDTQKNGVEISEGEIGLYNLSDINIDVGGDKLQIYNSSKKTWNEVSKKPLSNFSTIVADYFGDGVDGTYGIGLDYYLVKEDRVIAVHISESGNESNQYSFPTKNSESNAFQEQVVSLLNSVK